jgi:hypothetical protein
MTGMLPELAALPEGLVLDGELVAFNEEATLTSRHLAGACSTAIGRLPFTS